MNSKQRRVLAAIFKEPVSAGINWHDIEMLFLACGAELEEGAGSRVNVWLNGVRATFHRPHPEKETDKGAVKSVRRFLIAAGVTP